tara:strand:- start:3611 stop:3931 length:321 start_codon:yes stop_codon:yes gene_type:complete
MKTAAALPKITNAIDAEGYTRQMCEKHFNMLDFGMKQIIAKEEGYLEQELAKQAELTAIYKAEKSKWSKDFFSTNFPNLLNSHMGKVLMGLVKEDMNAYRHRTSEF